MTRAKQFEESVSLNPSFPLALNAVIGQMAQSFVIGLPHTARMTAMGRHYANVLLCDVQPKQNKIQIPDDSFFLIDNNFIYRALPASQLC